ncbi:MAG: hypothetical protein IJA31_11660 [Clostridia bacterium]|nr:hypothetical protein [Clostridia bacterium]
MLSCLLFCIIILLPPVLAFVLSKSNQTRRSFICIAAIALIAELFLFNMGAWHLAGGDYREQEIDYTQVATQNFTLNESGCIYAYGPCTAEVTIKNINAPVGSIYTDAQITAADAKIPVYADISDSTNMQYRNDIASNELIADYAPSNYMQVRMSGAVQDIRLQFKLDANETLTLKGIAINKAKPLQVSPLRALLSVAVGSFAFAFFNAPVLQDSFAKRKKENYLFAMLATCIFVGIAFFMVAAYGFGNWKSTTGNQITQSLVDAFRAGQVALLHPPGEDLLALENPYDWSARREAGIYYLWDHCLYGGNYYSYYGIAPVLLLFLPYNLLTGYYFPTPQAVLLFSVIGIVFLTLLWLEFIKKFFPQLPSKLVLLGLLSVQIASGVWFCLCSPLFYEIAQSSAFMFVVMGAYFLLKANLIGNGKVRIPFVGAGTVCLALAVLCRPTTAVYCAVSLLFLFFGFRKLQKENADKKRLVLYLANATVFFALIGGVQMIYNYLRFDSFFDFGIQYSLTINDFTRAQYHTRFVSIGLYNYLINPPVVSPEFPYISSEFQTLHPNGYYFIANKYCVGLIYRALPVLALLLSGSAWKKCADKGQKRTAALLIGALSIAAPFAILFSVWESGYGARYCMDFTWEILFGAFFVAFYLYTNSRNTTLKQWAGNALLFATAFSLLIAFAENWAFLCASIKDTDAIRTFAIMEHAMNFWM